MPLEPINTAKTRQRDRQTEIDTDRQTEIDTYIQTDRQRSRERERENSNSKSLILKDSSVNN